MTGLFIISLLTYFLGSINFSILVFKILGRGDPREDFSGNAGASNASRQIGKGWGFIILLLDIGRAGVIVLIGNEFLDAKIVPFLGLILILGNQKPLFHRFRGGKGVAAYLGFTLFLSPFTAGMACLAWLIGFGIFQQAFLGSFLMIFVLAIGTMIHFSWDPIIISEAGLTMGIIYYAHRANIRAYLTKKTVKK